MERQKIVIIGAGPAGLTASYELSKLQDKYDIVVLEALDQVGGYLKHLYIMETEWTLEATVFLAKMIV